PRTVDRARFGRDRQTGGRGAQRGISARTRRPALNPGSRHSNTAATRSDYRVAVKEPVIESIGPRIFISGPTATTLPHSNDPATPVSSARVSVTVHSPADDATVLTSGPTPTCTTIGSAGVVLKLPG